MKRLVGIALVLFVGTTAHAELEIIGLEAVHGPFGPKRENLTVYPGEEVNFRYRVAGAGVDAKGQIDVVVEERVTYEDGKEIVNASQPQRAALALGGTSFPAQAVLTFPDTAKSGGYKLTITVRDKISGGSAVGEKVVNLAPPQFAIMMPRFSYDAAGEVPAPPGGVLGQTLHLSLKAIGLDKSNHRVAANMKLQIVEAKSKKPTLPEPVVLNFRQDDPKLVDQITFVNFKANVALNRAGKFNLKMTVTDESTGKAATFESPLEVFGLDGD